VARRGIEIASMLAILVEACERFCSQNDRVSILGI